MGSRSRAQDGGFCLARVPQEDLVRDAVHEEWRRVFSDKKPRRMRRGFSFREFHGSGG